MAEQLPGEGARPGAARAPFPELVDGRYRVLRALGAGGMGEVFEAEHTALGKPVVMKVVHRELAKDQRHRERHRLEAQSVARLVHPNIVPVTDLGETKDGRPFIVMDKLEGRTLGDELRARRFLPVAEAIVIAQQVLAGLSAGHAIGVIHRDVKPGNIFLVGTGSARVAKVLDWGLAKVVGAGDGRAPAPSKYPTAEGTILGTPSYVSPEQVRGLATIDARADLYSLGIVLYRMLAGTGPFDGRSQDETLMAHVLAAPPPPSTRATQRLPAGLDAVVLKALGKEAHERYASALEFAAALEPFASYVAPPVDPAAATAALAAIADAGEVESDATTRSKPVRPGGQPRVSNLQGKDAELLWGTEYRPLERMGPRDVAETLRAEHVATGREVVIKVFCPPVAVGTVMPDEYRELGDRVRLEGDLLGQIASPFVTPIVDRGETPDGRPFIVTDPLPGRSVKAMLAERARFTVDEAVAIGRDVLKGLEAAHALGVVHRDVKAENVRFVEEHGATRAVVTDFGFAKVVERRSGAPAPIARATSEGEVLGTPRWFSPEQALGKPLDARSDVYQVGLLLFELVAGRGPFDDMGTKGPIARALLEAPPVSSFAPNVPAWFDKAVATALEKKASDRHASARAFIAVLESNGASIDAPTIVVPAVVAQASRPGSLAHLKQTEEMPPMASPMGPAAADPPTPTAPLPVDAPRSSATSAADRAAPGAAPLAAEASAVVAFPRRAGGARIGIFIVVLAVGALVLVLARYLGLAR